MTVTALHDRYVEFHVDDDDRGAVIQDRATGESILIVGTRSQQLRVLKSLNIAERAVEQFRRGSAA